MNYIIIHKRFIHFCVILYSNGSTGKITHRQMVFFCCTYMCTHTHPPTHTYTHTHRHTDTHTDTHRHTDTHTHLCILDGNVFIFVYIVTSNFLCTRCRECFIIVLSILKLLTIIQFFHDVIHFHDQ